MADVGGHGVSDRALNNDFQVVFHNSAAKSLTGGNVQFSSITNDNYLQYSPQRSGIINALTEIGTPNPNRHYVNKENTCSLDDSQVYFDSQPSESSQVSEFVPNQEFYAMLDKELLNLPKDAYIEKLIEVSHNSDDTITWYRSVLCSRARSIQGCPLGKLFTRKSTNKSTSAEKYAHDCYMLQQFISGDSANIEDIFRKDES